MYTQSNGITRTLAMYCISCMIRDAPGHSSMKHGFAEEVAFILKDAAFENKYKTTLEDVIKKRKQWPHGLLQGMSIYPTQHVQPPVDTLSAIVLSAGGKVHSILYHSQTSIPFFLPKEGTKQRTREL